MGNMKIAMSGASGFVGKNLTKHFAKQGWEVVPITREMLSTDGQALTNALSGSDAVVNLAGAPIIRRWSKRYKRKLYSSRIETTRKNELMAEYRQNWIEEGNVEDEGMFWGQKSNSSYAIVNMANHF